MHGWQFQHTHTPLCSISLPVSAFRIPLRAHREGNGCMDTFLLLWIHRIEEAAPHTTFRVIAIAQPCTAKSKYTQYNTLMATRPRRKKIHYWRGLWLSAPFHHFTYLLYSHDEFCTSCGSLFFEWVSPVARWNSDQVSETPQSR